MLTARLPRRTPLTVSSVTARASSRLGMLVAGVSGARWCGEETGAPVWAVSFTRS